MAPALPPRPERPRSLVPIAVLVGLAILGALWLVRIVTGLLWTLVQLAVAGVVVAVVLSLAFGSRGARRRTR